MLLFELYKLLDVDTIWKLIGAYYLQRRVNGRPNKGQSNS